MPGLDDVFPALHCDPAAITDGNVSSVRLFRICSLIRLGALKQFQFIERTSNRTY